jgi:CheY-like chemotaxis protein
MTKTVMIVDDDPDIRDAFSSILEVEGYDVVCAEHGQAALDYLLQGNARPCMIFLDLMMPIMDGEEFRDRQKKTAHADIPVVVVTAAGRDRRANIDAAEILQKPISYEKIMHAIEQYC